jgi:hypothetical protein
MCSNHNCLTHILMFILCVLQLAVILSTPEISMDILLLSLPRILAESCDFLNLQYYEHILLVF